MVGGKHERCDIPRIAAVRTPSVHPLVFCFRLVLVYIDLGFFLLFFLLFFGIAIIRVLPDQAFVSFALFSLCLSQFACIFFSPTTRMVYICLRLNSII